MLKTRLIPAAAGAYQYPLLIKSLMLSGRRYEKSHERGARRIRKKSYAKVFRASVGAETSRL
ncbi:hypothetical protein N1E68_19210, partial [Pseudomonas aeruginosa]|nr:hypothetical protein [Pseudomonas aeruginosa]MCS9415789.1 hypothetical protein [Pseudomonas aeruginosa]